MIILAIRSLPFLKRIENTVFFFLHLPKSNRQKTKGRVSSGPPVNKKNPVPGTTGALPGGGAYPGCRYI
jgi:hypothetical protein